jgi:hypothetical protein
VASTTPPSSPVARPSTLPSTPDRRPSTSPRTSAASRSSSSPPRRTSTRPTPSLVPLLSTSPNRVLPSSSSPSCTYRRSFRAFSLPFFLLRPVPIAVDTFFLLHKSLSSEQTNDVASYGLPSVVHAKAVLVSSSPSLTLFFFQAVKAERQTFPAQLDAQLTTTNTVTGSKGTESCRLSLSLAYRLQKGESRKNTEFDDS